MYIWIYIDTHSIYFIVCVYLLCMYIYSIVCVLEYYSAIKKNEILPFVTTWIDQKGIMLIEC